MSAPSFSDTLPLTRADEGVWAGETDPGYSNGASGAFVGQFGGWVSAALLKAALLEAADGQRARSLTAHFLTPVRPGAFRLQVRPLRKGKSVSFLQVELMQGADIRAQATVTIGAEREDQNAHQFVARPDAPPPETEGLGAFTPPTPFGRSLEARWVSGAPFMGEDGARSLFWSRTATPSRLDAVALALLADYMPPRVFYVTNAFVPSSTLSLTIHFHANTDDLAAVGESHVLVEVRGRRVGGGYWDHSASFFSAAGALLATTEQVALHRG